MSTATALRAGLCAALVLALGMGFGRFAFTGLYPQMLGDGLLDLSSGALAASANYAGYLLGALLLARAQAHQAAHLCRLALLGTLLGLAAMALPAPAWLAIAVRFGAGLCSALAMVGASLWLLQAQAQPQGASLLFSGVGAGILLSAELIAAGQRAALGSAANWLLLAGVGALLTALAWPALKAAPAQASADRHSSASAPAPSALGPSRLLLIYALAGFGYIVTATYLPLLLRDALGTLDPLQAWALFGLGAAPSCFLWQRLQRRLGTRRALAANLALQALGVVLPALASGPLAGLGSAVLVGGTFMGSVTIAMPAARQVAAQVRFNMLAAMTAAYGIGQIAGPLLCGLLLQRSAGFAPALLVAGAALLLAALSCQRRLGAPSGAGVRAGHG
ncbi:YbfB/YjiJ family MFS transporter [Pseudomonas panipatensis]|uniref:Predicted arabinose efflux permease, MFS family n=1 Tax=Pseudomonas panipatensis TaxID=428992 RepID=A0A1G8IMH9_9PSED|nr:YbfB/YjiJ family MFS transporter [Pseudomonas panipatensis]SDI20032.1 Predicted arabinose efflux permease, MFS family [Pseudomonas panipatensis]SMP73507.1 Predicted arabinose efflux permease, MFS family [Pseudomonas panipatensis]